MIDALSRSLIQSAADRSQRFLLGVAGVPGSGKSTFATQLVDQLNRSRDPGDPIAVVVGMDGFHLHSDELDARGWRDRKGAPHTFDAAGFIARLHELRRTPVAVVRMPVYDRTIHEPRPDALTVGAVTRIAIVEGNYLLLDEPPWDAVRPLLDEVWYLDVPHELAMQRVRARHVRGGLDAAAADRKITVNDLPNASIVQATRLRADRVLQPEDSTCPEH